MKTTNVSELEHIKFLVTGIVLEFLHLISSHNDRTQGELSTHKLHQ